MITNIIQPTIKHLVCCDKCRFYFCLYIDSGMNETESKTFGNLLMWMVGWIMLVIIIYAYILLTNLSLFIIVMSGELIDKGIEFLLKKMKERSH